MKKKTYFEAPSAELIVVRFEENILSEPTTKKLVEEEDDIFG